MVLSLDKINKSFDKNHVLKDVAFTAQSGVAMGLLGRNGSGKTTTIRIILDIFPADSGAVTIDGHPSREFIKRIGYLPEERGLYPKLKIIDQMVYFGQLRGMKAKDAKERAKKLLQQLDAEEYINQKLETLSKGNQQKIQLAISLITDPEIIILDEPFSGLDPVNAKILKEIVEELVKKGKMVLFSSHQMGYVETFCDDICLINKGTCILQGNLNKIKKSYPRNRILLTPENEDNQSFQNRLSSSPLLKPFIQDISMKKNGCIVTLSSEKDKTSFLQVLSQSDMGIDAFQIVEPTLEEIFVEKVGSADETV